VQRPLTMGCMLGFLAGGGGGKPLRGWDGRGESVGFNPNGRVAVLFP
jgi:hypothetical protein